MRRLLRCFGSAAVFALLAIGCGSQPKQVRVTGTITFQGKPLGYGTVTFEPDHQKGNSGAQGFAKIKEGRFDTAVAGKPCCTGPITVVIEGYAEVPAPGSKSATLISYRTSVEISGDPATVTVDVPASAARQESVITLPPP